MRLERLLRVVIREYRPMSMKGLGRQGVDAVYLGQMVRDKRRVEKKTVSEICEYMRCHSARVPKSCGRFRAGPFVTCSSLISTIPLAR